MKASPPLTFGLVYALATPLLEDVFFGKKPEVWEDGVTDRSGLGRDSGEVFMPHKGFRKTALTSCSHRYKLLLQAR